MQIPIVHIQLDENDVPRTINSRVKVRMIAEQHYNDLSVDDIATHYHISLGDVYAALAYYHDNGEFFEQQSQSFEPHIESAKRYTDTLKAKIQQRFASNNQSDM